MSKLTTNHVPVTIADGTYEIPCFGEESVSVGLSNRTFGDPTAGTLVFRGKVAGEAKFQSINVIDTIDFADYAGITIDTAVLAVLEVTTLGVTGTGLSDELFLAINRFDYRV